MNGKRIVLASSSPRRRELMRFITEQFEIITSDAEEKTQPGLSPEETVKALAELKADDVFPKATDSVVIAADTVVACDGRILGKPADRTQAFAMLKSLSGRTHSVFTGVCIREEDRKKVFAIRSDVTFYDLTDREIGEYIATGEPDDKAGAYGIQGKGCLLVESISGDYFNIVGLPVARLKKELADFSL